MRGLRPMPISTHQPATPTDPPDATPATPTASDPPPVPVPRSDRPTPDAANTPHPPTTTDRPRSDSSSAPAPGSSDDNSSRCQTDADTADGPTTPVALPPLPPPRPNPQRHTPSPAPGRVAARPAPVYQYPANFGSVRIGGFQASQIAARLVSEFSPPLAMDSVGRVRIPVASGKTRTTCRVYPGAATVCAHMGNSPEAGTLEAGPCAA